VGASIAAALLSRGARAERSFSDVTAIHSRAGVEATGATFALRGLSGAFTTTSAIGEIAPVSALSLRLRVPVSHATYDGDGGAPHVGLGDLELRLRWRIRQDALLQASVGVAGSQPPGRRETHLGDGGGKVAPYVSAGYAATRTTIVYTTVSDQISIPISPGDAIGDVTDPSSDHELRGDLGLIQRLGDVLFVSASTSGALRLVRRGPGDFAYASAFVGATPSSDVRIVVGGSIPLAGEHRFESRTTASMLVSF
jgi:hypothetical protein